MCCRVKEEHRQEQQPATENPTAGSSAPSLPIPGQGHIEVEQPEKSPWNARPLQDQQLAPPGQISDFGRMVLTSADRDYVGRMHQDISGMKVLVFDSQTVPKEQCRDPGMEEEEQHRNPFLNNVGDVKLSSSLLAPKPQFRYQISVARWDEEMRLGEIIKMKGSIWTSMGAIRNGGKLYCTIEEILFLVERGALHLLDGKDVVLSLNDIYKKVSEGKSGCSWECFVVFRHLKSLGYIVRRHGLPWALKSEKNRCFDTPLSSTSLFAKLDDNDKSDRELDGDVHLTQLLEAMQINALKLEFDVFLPNSKFKKASPGHPNFVLSLISEKPPTRREVEDLERQCDHVPLKFCNVDHGRVSFYSFDKIDLPVLP